MYTVNKKTAWLKGVVVSFLVLVIVGISLYIIQMTSYIRQTLQWKPLVQQVLEEEDLLEYEDLVLSIIFTETKGKQIDIMQSSESKYGEQNKVMSQEESIRNGVTHLSESIELSLNSGGDLWTGVQAYNFGKNYIDYVANNGGTNSLEIAENYSRDVLAPMLGNTTKKTYPYRNKQAFFYNGGKLYVNGGNFFYSTLVKKNMKLINFFDK